MIQNKKGGIAASANESTRMAEVENGILRYVEEHDLHLGDALPGEVTWMEMFGVSRSVIREALSRFRMMGLIESRTKRGMTLSEPNVLNGFRYVLDSRFFRPETLIDLLELRISLEIGIASQVVHFITDQQLEELSEIVNRGAIDNEGAYEVTDEFAFHAKLYEISQNRLINEFQSMLHPIMTYAKELYKKEFYAAALKLKEDGTLYTHSRLLEVLKTRDAEKFQLVMQWHFVSYQRFIRKQRSLFASEKER